MLRGNKDNFQVGSELGYEGLGYDGRLREHDQFNKLVFSERHLLEDFPSHLRSK